MVKPWMKAVPLMLLIVLPLWSAPVQSPAEIVGQVITEGASLRLNLVCKETSRVTSFTNGVLTSVHTYKALVATPRTANEQGILDLNSGYREVLSIDDKPLPKPTPTSNVTAGSFFGSSAGFVFSSSRRFFDFTTVGLEPSSGQQKPKLIVQFARKRGAEAPWFIPDSGKAWIEPDSKALTRLDILDLDLKGAPRGALFRDHERTIREDFGSFIVDGSNLWLVKTRSLQVINKLSKKLMETTDTEYSDCRRFDVSSTFKPLSQ